MSSKGEKTNCAECGCEYIQDLDIKPEDYDTEMHPDFRLLCPKCRKSPKYAFNMVK